MQKSIHTNEKGFVMLFTVLIVSIILSLAIGIANIGYKQSLLSSIGKDSQIAFYAADAGMECALLYMAGTGFPPGPITCGDVQLDLQPVLPTTNMAYMPRPTGSTLTQPCFYIYPVSNSLIRVSGYNICDPTNPRRVERALEVQLN